MFEIKGIGREGNVGRVSRGQGIEEEKKSDKGVRCVEEEKKRERE